MIEDDTTLDYKGNGWSKYQIYVLKQLEEHNQVLKILTEKMGTFAATMQQIQNENNHCANVLADIRREIQDLKKNDSNTEERLDVIETDKKVEKETSARSKALWTAIGGAVVVILGFVFQLIGHIVEFVDKFNNPTP